MGSRVMAAVAAVTVATGAWGGPASAGVIHAYDFATTYASGGGTFVSDLVGSADGELLGGASVSGGALVLDGQNDFVQFASHLVPTAGADFSVLLRVSIDAVQSASIVEFISQGVSNAPGFYIGTDSTGAGFRLSDVYHAPNLALPSRGVFHDLFLTNGAGGFRFSIDGVEVFSAAAVGSYTALGSHTRLGRQFDPFGEFFHGEIDTLRVFDTVVTYAEANAPLGGGAVPEPATWAMMLLGFAGLGAALRTRRRVGPALA